MFYLTVLSIVFFKKTKLKIIKELIIQVNGDFDHPRAVSKHSFKNKPQTNRICIYIYIFICHFSLYLPGLPPPNGDCNENSMCFCESKRTMNDGMLTTCFLTLF